MSLHGFNADLPRGDQIMGAKP